MTIEEKAFTVRQRIFKIACCGSGAHIAPALSIADLVTVLYFDGVLRYDERNPDWGDRDFFILSKGHACLALYAVLSMAGFFDSRELHSFTHKGSRFGGHPKMGEIPGVEASTGALGHGMLFASGIALANKMDGKDSAIYDLNGRKVVTASARKAPCGRGLWQRLATSWIILWSSLTTTSIKLWTV